jgi:hypothetical protein
MKRLSQRTSPRNNQPAWKLEDPDLLENFFVKKCTVCGKKTDGSFKHHNNFFCSYFCLSKHKLKAKMDSHPLIEFNSMKRPSQTESMLR